ncbi:hypothetical protein DL764_010660 [Monosporascus ibericus]|uniref:Heterokaryon incompatibility domain-containing protein n=1 Tax=Monosporascus ibericus TaxID=155417 RepID=A0A4Q4SV00_9PEZI|nr:hypothetical protein DL764_010660 [Monosporascus ibericus]
MLKLLPQVRSSFPPFWETVRVQIIEESLDHPHPFNALSYTWGNVGRGPPNRKVIVETSEGQRDLRIYEPLETALLSLVNGRTAELPLFIDQISTNQADNDEKASQVKLMGEIYTKCERVIVWLGPSTPHSDEYFTFASDICSEGVLSRVMGPNVGHFREVFDAVMDSTVDVGGVVREDRDDILRLVRLYGHHYPIRGAVDVLGRPWFNRLWVIQEVCLAPQVVFTCGSSSLCFDCFRAGLLFYTIWNKPFIRTFQQRKAIHQESSFMSLYDLVIKYSVNEDGIKVGAKLSEDRIFGLLGLARADEIMDGMKVDYNNVRNTYTMFAALAARHNLDVLLFSQKSDLDGDLPCWVPNWSISCLRTPYGYSNLTTPVFSAGGSTISQPPIADLALGKLTVQGFSVDRVNRVGVHEIQRDVANDSTEQIYYPSFVRFLDEINEFLGSARKTEGSRFQDAPDQQLHDEAAIRLTDGGLSARQFPDTFDPTTAQDTLWKIHRNVYRVGQVEMNAELKRQSYSVTRFIRTVGIVPWYWVPASEVDVLRLCATNPIRAAWKWVEAACDFVTDMVGVVLASSALQLTAWFLHMKQQYYDSVDLAAANHKEVFRHVGLDSEHMGTREWMLYTSNLYRAIGRRLFLTERGYVGLGPEHMENGDAVVVLVGSSVPHILRPDVETDAVVGSSQTNVGHEGKVSSVEPRWSYVGEAYCDGIMDGELLREGRLDYVQFHIF